MRRSEPAAFCTLHLCLPLLVTSFRLFLFFVFRSFPNIAIFPGPCQIIWKSQFSRSLLSCPTIKPASKNLKIKNLLASNLSFIPPLNKNVFSLENEKQVLIFKNHHLVMQSWVRILKRAGSLTFSALDSGASGPIRTLTWARLHKAT